MSTELRTHSGRGLYEKYVPAFVMADIETRPGAVVDVVVNTETVRFCRGAVDETGAELPLAGLVAGEKHRPASLPAGHLSMRRPPGP